MEQKGFIYVQMYPRISTFQCIAHHVTIGFIYAQMYPRISKF